MPEGAAADAPTWQDEELEQEQEQEQEQEEEEEMSPLDRVFEGMKLFFLRGVISGMSCSDLQWVMMCILGVSALPTPYHSSGHAHPLFTP